MNVALTDADALVILTEWNQFSYISVGRNDVKAPLLEEENEVENNVIYA